MLGTHEMMMKITLQLTLVVMEDKVAFWMLLLMEAKAGSVEMKLLLVDREMELVEK